MESSKETGCQTPEGPILCIKNCGFFGSAATMNMCSKCHKEMTQQEKHATIPIFGPQGKGKESTAFTFPGFQGFQFGSEVSPPQAQSKFSFGANSEVGSSPFVSSEVKANGSFPFAASSEVKANAGFPFVANSEVKANAGPNRCTTCNKRVGLTGFRCRCENVFCAVHRYTDKHDCQFDYRAAAQDAIAKANPVIKAAKLDKI